ncbi:hypothetical protein LINPERPRIM_LOCUS9750 [Linum perenne]
MNSSSQYDAAFDDVDDELDTLSLCDLPLHSTTSTIDLPAPTQTEDFSDQEFEFSSEYLINPTTTTHSSPHHHDHNATNNNIIFCGKLITSKQSIDYNSLPKQSNSDSDKKQSSIRRRFFSWKSSSASSSTSSSSSSSSSWFSSSSSSTGSPKPGKKNRKMKMGYLCLGIGVEWKFPVKSMEIKEIKMRQSRRMRSFTLDDDRSPNLAVGSSNNSGNGMWSLLGILAGGRP